MKKWVKLVMPKSWIVGLKKCGKEWKKMRKYF